VMPTAAQRWPARGVVYSSCPFWQAILSLNAILACPARKLPTV